MPSQVMDIIDAEFRIEFAELQRDFEKGKVTLAEYVNRLNDLIYRMAYKKGWRDAVQHILEQSIL